MADDSGRHVVVCELTEPIELHFDAVAAEICRRLQGPACMPLTSMVSKFPFSWVWRAVMVYLHLQCVMFVCRVWELRCQVAQELLPVHFNAGSYVDECMSRCG